MKISIFSTTSSFNKKARDYVTQADVGRANALLTGHPDLVGAIINGDAYTKYNISQPTSKQIEAAAESAMRQARLDKVF